MSSERRDCARGDEAPLPDLRLTLSIWNPKFTVILASLMALAIATAPLAYLTNAALYALTSALAQAEASSQSPSALMSIAGPLIEWLRSATGITDVGLFLAGFAALSLLGPIILRYVEYLTEVMFIRGTNALDIATVQHLLAKDDYFFSSHSLGEISNRFAIDVPHSAALRGVVVQSAAAAATLLGNLFFFYREDGLLATLGFFLCAIAVVTTLLLSRAAPVLEAAYLKNEDAMRAQMEDYVRMAAEIQVCRLSGRAADVLRRIGALRNLTYLRRQWFVTRLDFGKTFGSVAALLVMIAAVYVSQGSAGAKDISTLTAIPVILWALPQVYAAAFQLAMARVRINFARASIRRLLEYGSAPAPAAGMPAPLLPAVPSPMLRGRAGAEARLRLANVTYRHPGIPNTGIFDVSTTLRAGEWTAIIGRAGSGKSTLLNVILGRYQPQAGTVSFHASPDGAMERPLGAPVISYLPQKHHLLAATILENIRFAHPSPEGLALSQPIEPREEAIIEAIGLAHVCREKSLDLMPQIGEADGHALGTILDVRQQIKERVALEGIDFVRRHASGSLDPEQLVIEALLGGKCRDNETVALLTSRRANAVLGAMAATPMGAALAASARAFIDEARPLIASDSQDACQAMCARPIHPDVWELLGRMVWAKLSRVDLMRVALLSAVEPADRAWSLARDLERGPAADTAAVAQLRALVGGLCIGFDEQAIHPWRTWRENLIFGSIIEPTATKKARLEAIIVEQIENSAAKSFFTMQGLRYQVGRQGGNLSGGQGQLVALCRALVRDGDMVILDEPTSALDPRSKAAIVDVLREQSKDVFLIVVTHDRDLLRYTDRIIVMSNGRIIADGHFNRVSDLPEFRNIMTE